MNRLNNHLRNARDYDVVIVNYNGEKIITACLNSIYSSTVQPSKVIIYDNHSSDQSLKIIEKKFPDVILIKGDQNVGFGRANNRSILSSTARFILFVNNDVILDKRCAEELLKGFNDQNIAIIDPIIYKGWEKTRKQAIYAFGAEINDSGFGYGLYDQGQDRTDLNSFSATCFMAVSDIFKKYQFEHRFFLYYEEPDLSIRLLKDGYQISRIKAARCFHLESFSSPKKRTDGIAFRQLNGVPNRWYMLGKHWPAQLLPKALVINYLHLLYLTYFYIRNGRLDGLKLLYRAPFNLFVGFSRRSTHPIKNPLWFRRLERMPISHYFRLGKKVFGD